MTFCGGVIVGRPELGLETVGISGLGHELLRLGQIVRPRTDLDCVLHALRRHALRRRRVARERDLGQRLLVDRVRDRLPHLGIIEGLLLRVHREVAQHNRGRGHHFQLRLALQDIGLFVRNREGEMCLSGLHDRRA